MRIPRRQSLPSQVAREFLAAIVSGTYQPSTRLPAEHELVALTGVSRLTLREAMKLLEDKGVVRIEQGRGTFVNPQASWSPLDPMILTARAADPAAAGTISRKLLEARRPFYERAHAGVETVGQTPREIVDDLLRLSLTIGVLAAEQAEAHKQ